MDELTSIPSAASPDAVRKQAAAQHRGDTHGLVYRIQDAEGRGPFRPGFSRRWLDDTAHCSFPSWIEEFGWCIPADLEAQGWHFGSAVRSTDGIAQWFSRSERRRLHRLGYDVVAIQPDRILAESERQLVIARQRAFTDGAIIVAAK